MQKRMDWSHIDFDWNRVRAFLVTAEEGSYTAASRALRVAQPTIGRQVAALEEELGVALFERVGRGIELTPAGLELVEHVRVMGEAASRIALVAAGQSMELAGSITISASEIISAVMLPPVIAELTRAHPNIEVELLATNDTSDLRRREADIAIRNHRPDDPELIARNLTPSTAYLYASSSYLDRIGRPASLEELGSANFIGFDHGPRLMQGLNAMGLSLTKENFGFVSANQLVQWGMVKAGVGVAIMMREVGDAEPGVERALESFPGIPVPMWLTSHRELRTSRRVRVVFDLLAAALSD